MLRERTPVGLPSMTDNDMLLNSREVAFLLDLSPDTVNEFARRSLLPAFKKGRQWRFRKRDIAAFKRQQKGIDVAA
jgi:excisionase family DNA binding protein